ncbi:MAG: hypothetical protein ACRDRG_00170 [Pseudonocardiaceae bacterium]
MTTDPIKITEIERPLRTAQPANLQREVWHLLHQNARKLQAVREEAGRQQANDHDQLRNLVIDLARAHHQLRVFLDRHTGVLEGASLGEQSSLLATIRDRYEQVLTRAGAELIYHDGRPFTFEIDHQVQVTAWIPTADVDRPRVRATLSPGVLLGGELICQAQIEVETAIPDQPVVQPQEVTDEPCDRD